MSTNATIEQTFMPSYFDPLWVITSYYNPAKYGTRYDNFKLFRKLLNAPLLTVELARSGHHRLTREDGDMVLALVGEDRIWQKERLLNIALAALPAHVEYVAWIDSDIIFEDRDWAAKAQRRLSRQGGLLQLFETALHLPPDVDLPNLSAAACARCTPVVTGVSIASAMAAADNEAKPIEATLHAERDGRYLLAERSVAVGMAWAAHRATMAACGFYDRNVVGGGDSVQAFAALDRLDDYYSYRRLTRAHQTDARLWAEAARSTGLFTMIDALDSKLYHLWHGVIEDRDYRGRHDILYRHDFDPRRDIHHSPNGTWEWSNPLSALANDVGAYFFSRREDGARLDGQAPRRQTAAIPGSIKFR